MKHAQTPRKWKDFNDAVNNTTEILPNETYIFDLSDHYEVYDFGFLTNMSANSDAVLILNGSQQQPAIKREVTPINFPFRSVAVKNIGASNIAIGELQLNYSYKSTKQNLINRGFQLLPLTK